MKYLITGGAGFIGSHLVEKLIDDGNTVICVDDLSTGNTDYLPEDDSLKFFCTKIQAINSDDLEQDINGIFHLAAQPSVPVSIDNFYESSDNNLLGTLKVWDLAIKLNIPVIYASSSAVYGDLPLGDDQLAKYDIMSPYAQDKLTMEDYAMLCWKVYNISAIGLRLFNVYGPRQDPDNPYSGVISIFIDRLMQNKPVTVNGGYQSRDFIFVKDVVDVMFQSMEYLFNNRSCEVMNVGTGISITIDHLLTMLTDIMKVKPEIILKELPPGDPERSSGTFKKMKNILNIDTNQFAKLVKGLRISIEFVENSKSC